MTIKNLKQQRALERRQREEERIRRMYEHEDRARDEGFEYIAGVDEAGRGSLAGSIVVAAVILPADCVIENLNDSKKLTPQRRETLYYEIIDQAIACASVIADVDQIDQMNVYDATIDAMYRAVDALTIKPQFVLTDAMTLNFKDIRSKGIIHGDALSASIAAASIIAKVTRDRLADEWDAKWPQYGFAKHRGYGTKAHIDAIKRYGKCDIHRKTYEPVKSMFYSRQLRLFDD